MRLTSKTGFRRRVWGKRALATLTAVFVFLVGVNVGSGKIDIPWPQRYQAVTGSLPNQLDYSSVNQVYQSIKDNYDGKLNEEQLIDGLKHGLAAATGDPYTTYFTPKEASDFESQLNNSFAGIGARLSKDTDGNLVVGEAIAGFPAQKAGLQAQDIIVQINGKDAGSLSLDDAILNIRGPAGTKVKLQVVRDRLETLTFDITRQEIKIPSVNTKLLDSNIGYIQITSFSDDTVSLAKKAATDFKAKNVKGIVLDLRDNPGGLLEASVGVSSMWLDQGKPVLQEKRGNTTVKSYSALGGSSLKNVPTVVLINGGSASASEITAGALRDHKAAYVIGEKSYGKGVVQELINFGDGSQLKVTVASWYRPNGKTINKQGITPDKRIKNTPTEVKAGVDAQLQAAQQHLSQ